ncbi:MAG: C40 family peptidase [Candidatus Harrisonbacteria bacterium]|nr:C40 family peptidase [Candidatus Harrisonbacteria bacterium]
MFNVNITRRAYQQAGLGTVVRDEQDLMPGDLLFFEGHIAGRRPIIVEGKEYWVGHVAICVGNGEIVHCTRADGVHRRPLNEYRDKKLVLMKRILPDVS